MALNRATSGWTKPNAKTALEARAFYRGIMDRVRLTDLAEDLKWLEEFMRKRAQVFQACQKRGGFSVQAQVEMFAALEGDDLALARRLVFMREKLGWVLQP